MTRLVAVLLCSFSLFADDVVFRGTPTTRLLASPTAESRDKLEGEDARKNECTIVLRGKRYYWASRGNVPVMRVDAQQFTYFIHEGGSGYVKVYTGQAGTANANADYVEQISRGFETITYWGRALTRGGEMPESKTR